ncbi:MAG: hypothetical protein AB9897_03040, partial [Anaerolineaceae bacterium]
SSCAASLKETLLSGKLTEREDAQEQLEAFRWQPSKDKYGMAYWYYSHWNHFNFTEENHQKCLEIGISGVECLIHDLDGKNGWELLSTFYRLDPRDTPRDLLERREHILNLLEAISWKPAKDAYSATYWIVKKNWQKCIKLGTIAIDPLTSELSVIDDEELATTIIEVIGKIDHTRLLDSILSAFTYRIQIFKPVQFSDSVFADADASASKYAITNGRICKHLAEILGEIGDERALVVLEQGTHTLAWFNRDSAKAAIQKIKARKH